MNKVKNLKQKLVLYELLPILVVIFLFIFLGDTRQLGLTFCESYFDQGDGGITDPFYKMSKNICYLGAAAKLSTYILFPYMLFLVILLTSRLRSAPVMWLRGIYVSTPNKQDATVSFSNAAKFVFLNTHIIPLYIFILWFGLYDFSPNFMVLGKATIVSSFLAFLFLTLNHMRKSELTIDEYFSGVRIQVPEKILCKLNSEKRKTHFIRKYKYYVQLLFLIIGLAFWSLLSINILRDIHLRPHNYQKILYDRPDIQWEDNAALALNGINAPESVSDFYNLGREFSIYKVLEFNTLKEGGGISYIQNIPEISFTHPVENLNQEFFSLEFIDGENINFSCFYDLNYQENNKDVECSKLSVVPQIVKENKVLFNRFEQLPDFKYVSFPDTSAFDGSWRGQSLISLSQLKASQIIWLQNQGRDKEAMQEWLRYYRFYRNLLNSNTNMVEKAIFMVMYGSQIKTLETLLFNNPELAKDFKHDIKRELEIQSIDDFRASTFYMDDWKQIEPWARKNIGVPYHIENKFLECFEENKVLAQIETKDFPFNENRALCTSLYDYTEGIFGKSTIELLLLPGEPISNIVYQLLLGGLLKGQELIGNMHYNLVEARMAQVALELIDQNIKPENVVDFLKSLPPETHNPLTNKPFEWDRESSSLYYYKHYDETYKFRFKIKLEAP